MRAVFAAAGVDFDQWKALTRVALKLDFRTSSLGRSQFRREAGTIAALIGQFIFYTLMGAFMSLFVWFSRDVFLVSTIAMTYVMFVVGTAVLVDHNSALASPTDYAILGFRPVTSRTYFAVRLTNVLVYTLALTSVAGWLPILSLFLRHGAAVGFAGIAAFYACSLATALAILMGYAWMLRVIGPAAVKRALSYVQLAMSFLVYGGYFVMTQTVGRVVTSTMALPKTRWLLLYPATWFGSYIELASGKLGPLEIVPAVASVAVLFAMAASLSGRLSLEYSERLGAMTAAAAPVKAASRGASKGGVWFKTGEARAVALLVRSQFRNDQRFRMGVLAILPMTMIYLFSGLNRGALHDPFESGLRGSNNLSGVTMAIMMFPSLLKMHLTRSESFRASWIFFVSPADRMKIVRSSMRVLIAFFLLPYLAFVTLVYAYFVGNLFHVVVHIGLQGLLSLVVLQTTMLIDPALPFSRPTQKGRDSFVLLLFLMFITMISVFLSIFSAQLYGSVVATIGMFAAVLVVSLVIDLLTRARVGLQTASLEFEG
jgi:hypothetical protein